MNNYWFGSLGFLFVAVVIYIGSNFLISLSSSSEPAQGNILHEEAIQPVEQPTAEPVPLAQEPTQPRKLEWEELMPAEDLALLEAMEPIDHATMNQDELKKDLQPRKTQLKPEGNISQFEKTRNSKGNATANKKRTWRDALVSTRTRPELNLQKIKIAGYIVPLEFNLKHMLTDFFLVPYFGACIHVPPPPPNQIIYVRIPKGLPAQEIYTPFWVEGTLKIETKHNDLGISSYSLDADGVAAYMDE